MTSENEGLLTKLGTTQRSLHADEELEFEEDVYYSETKQHLRGTGKDLIKITECSRLSNDPRELLKYANRSFENNEESPHQAFLKDTFNQAKENLSL